jgi:hypothetical protein
MPAFLAYTFRATRQVRNAPGFLGGSLLMETNNTFWTMTAWDDATAMNTYRTSGTHRNAMPKLLNWCDEASVVHWQQQGADLPSWKDAHHCMVEESRLSKVNHPRCRKKREAFRLPGGPASKCAPANEVHLSR